MDKENNHVFLFSDEDRTELLYQGNTYKEFLEERQSDFVLMRDGGKSGTTVIYLKDGKMLVIKFNSFKVMMTIGIKQMNLNMEEM